MTFNLSTNNNLINAEQLIDFCARVYHSIGVPIADAQFAADTLVQADLWGHQSHGVLRLAWYYARLKSGAMKAVTKVDTVVNAGAVAVIDGNDGMGPAIAKAAVLEACQRAKLHGIGVVSVRNSNHFGTCMYYTRMAAKQGCIGMLMSNAGPNMAPWGGRQKKIGTNPWSIAVPGGKHDAIVMDMANSGVARGKIYLAKNRGESIPNDWAIDKEGRPTNDPAAAIEGLILPMAGHKGYVFGVMIDILSGVLSGSSFLDQVHGPYDPNNRSGAGHLMICMNVDAFQPLAEFEEKIEAYVTSLKDVPLAQGFDQIFYPGEMETLADQKNRATGILLPEETLQSLMSVSKETGVDW